MRSLWILLPALAVLGALSGSGCTKKTFEDGVLRMQLSGEPISLDPALAEDGLSMRILYNVMDGLMGYDGAGELHPSLAESFQISSDGRRYEFLLRKDARWSDGKPVTPQDFVFAMRRTLSPQTGSKMASVLFPIRGAEAYHRGKAKEQELGVSESGGKLIVELERPTPYFIQVFTFPGTFPVREDSLKNGKWHSLMPTTGAYRIVQHTPEQKYQLEANPSYWGKRPPLSRIELLVVADEATGVNLFERNRLHVLSKVTALDHERFKTRGLLRQDLFYGTYYLAFNASKPPFGDRDWRRAVAGSVRKLEIATALGSDEIPAYGFVAKGLEGYIPFESGRADFSDSIARVKSSSAPRPKVVFGFDTSGRNTLIVEKIQQDLQAALGIRIELMNMDWKSYVKTMQTDATPIYRFGWLAPFNDPILFLRAFVSDNPVNYSKWKNSDYDRLVDEIARLAPGPERAAKIREAQEILVNREAIVVPIFHYVQTHAVSPSVAGFRANPYGVVKFNELSLK